MEENKKDINKIEKPNLYYVKVLGENGKFVVRQARFKRLVCRIDTLKFDTSTEKLKFGDGKIESEIELAGVDSPIINLSFNGSQLNGLATFEAAKDESNSLFYFFCHKDGIFVNFDGFEIKYKQVENELKKLFEVKKQTYWDDNGNVSEEFDVKVFGWYWDGIDANAEEMTNKIYYNVLNGKIETPYNVYNKNYYPSYEACKKDNELVCYRFDD